MKHLRVILTLILGLACAGSAFAQPDPNIVVPEGNQLQKQLQNALATIAQRAISQPTLLERTPQGLFLLRNGVVAKFDPVTLNQQAAVELFGPMPALPGAAATQADKQKWLTEQAKRMAPAAMLVIDQNLLVVIGDEFFRVDVTKLEVKVTVDLTQDDQPFLAGARLLLTSFSPPSLLLDEKTLYITRGDWICSLNFADGKILSEGQLPEQMQPQFLGGLGPLLRPARPARDKNRPAAQPEQPREMTVIGEITKHTQDSRIIWTVKDQNGDEYVPTGDMAVKMLAQPNLDGCKVRITGIFARSANATQIGKGTIEVTDWQALPK